MRGAKEHHEAIKASKTMVALLMRTLPRTSAPFRICLIRSNPFLIVPYQALADLIRQAGILAFALPFQGHMTSCCG